MLDKARALNDYKLHDLDGELGRVHGSYFDDHHWTLRYLVADTGRWLADRLILISPHAISEVNREERYIAVDLTDEQIKGSPALNGGQPLSLQFEEAYFEYYDWPTYWHGPFTWGPLPYVKRGHRPSWEVNPKGRAWGHRLRDSSVVSGYDIHAADGTIGRVEDLVIDDESWAIRYLLIDTLDLGTSRKALFAPKWIERVSWDESKVFVDLSREAVRRSPEYADASMPTREYEIGLYRHYDRPGYWSDGKAAIAERPGI